MKIIKIIGIVLIYIIGGMLIGSGCSYADVNQPDEKILIPALSIIGLILISFFTYKLFKNNPTKFTLFLILLYSIALFIYGQYVLKWSDEYVKNMDFEDFKYTLPTLGIPIYYITAIGLFLMSFGKIT